MHFSSPINSGLSANSVSIFSQKFIIIPLKFNQCICLSHFGATLLVSSCNLLYQYIISFLQAFSALPVFCTISSRALSSGLCSGKNSLTASNKQTNLNQQHINQSNSNSIGW